MPDMGTSVPRGFGEWPWADPKGPHEYDSGPLNRLFTVWSHSGQAYAKFEADALAIRDNPELSAEGKARGIRRALAAHKKSLFFGEHCNRIRDGYKEMRALETKLAAPSDKGADPTLTFLERQELRTWLRSLDADSRRAAIRNAVTSKDEKLLAAIHTAPRAMGLVRDPQIQRAIETALNSNRDPETYRALEVLKSALLAAQQSVAVSIERAHRVVGVEPDKRVPQLSTAANVLSDPQLAASNFEEATAAALLAGNEG
jgi:hypothetical protein